jgi:hypothetical protein
MKHTILFFFLLIKMFSANSQYLSNEYVDESGIYKWETDNISEYFAVYEFGESEAEFKIVVFGDGEFCFAQRKEGTWADNDVMKFVWDYLNYNDVKIEGNKFLSEKFSGEFVYYDSEFDDYEGIYGLKLSFGSNPEYEIGKKSRSYEKYFSGKFPQASYRYLLEDELKKMTKSDLRIMRNEIFARYGYIFREGGTMSNYFKTQKWYKAEHKNVDDFLTNLEKVNIEKIQQTEKQK